MLVGRHRGANRLDCAAAVATYRAVKGMHDLLPEECARARRVEDAFRRTMALHGFGEIKTPIVEPTELFVRSVGETTDIVEKEMYTWQDRSGDSLSLRPEGTASAVRAYVEHAQHAQGGPVKWWYWGPMYRRERPQKGRYRQFWQGGAEILGDPGPHADAELIDLVATFFTDLGAQGVEVLVNSLGGPSSRPVYREALVSYLDGKPLCADCQRRKETNPLRVLDCKVPADQAISAGAPSTIDHLSEDDRAHFEGLTASLSALGTAHRVDPRLVRGFDYYTRTLFEVRGSGGELGAQSALCGGGRYDALVEEIGGASTPAIGFAMGIERILLVLPAPTDPAAGPTVFVATAGPGTRAAALRAARDLRRAGVSAEADHRDASLKAQLRRADKLRAKYALIVGADELARGAAMLRDLATKDQREIPLDDVARAIGGVA